MAHARTGLSSTAQDTWLLHNYWRSSASYRVRIALNVKGIPFEFKHVHLIKDGGEQYKPEFLKINPMAQVPYLIHNEFGLSQSMAILQYLDEVHPQPQIFPKDAKTRAKVWEICEIINSGIQPLMNVSVLKDLGQRFGATEQQQQQFAHFWIEKGLTAVEQLLNKYRGVYAVGDQLTAADILLVPQHYGSLRQKIAVEQYVNFHSIVQMLLGRPEFANAHPDLQPQN